MGYEIKEAPTGPELAADELKSLQDMLKKIADDANKADAERKSAIDQLCKDVATGSKTTKDTEAKLSRITEDQAKGVANIEALKAAIDEMAKKIDRPVKGTKDGDDAERKSAIGYAKMIHTLKTAGNDAAETVFDETKHDIDGYVVARRAMKKFLHLKHSDDKHRVMSAEEIKAMDKLAFAGNSFILAPEMSSEIISCLVDQTDVVGLFSAVTISKGSIKYLVDNVRTDAAAWACESDCFANNPRLELEKGLGEKEIKAHGLRLTLCATRDFMDDAEIDIESWMNEKVREAFRLKLSSSFMSGDGDGKPSGIIHPKSGVPVCDVKPSAAGGAAAGQFTWQDLVALKWQVPIQYHQNLSWLMNQGTLGAVMTMSGTDGRPLWVQNPGQSGAGLIDGNPVRINTWMPGIATGSAPVGIGNWNKLYRVVNRKAVEMQRDDFSFNYCVGFKFEARVGGDVLCPDAARFMRVA